MRMRHIVPAVLSLFVLMSAVPASAASTEGTLTINGKTTTLSHGYATTRKNAFDDKKSDVLLVFADRELPAGAISDDFQLLNLSDQGISGATVQIDADRSVNSGSLFGPALKMKQFSASGMQKVEITSWTESNIAGRVSVPARETFGEKWQYGVTFDLPIAGKAAAGPAAGKTLAAGKPLPAGGGEPGKAYENYRKTLAAGNLPALRKVLVREMAQQTEDPEFKEMLPMIQSMQPKKIRITGGSADGDTATLLVTSLDEANTTGTITMKREGGQWKLEHEAWKSN